MDNFLTIKEAVNKYIAGCEAKIRTSPAKLVLKAVLAGMMIALGAAWRPTILRPQDRRVCLRGWFFPWVL